MNKILMIKGSPRKNSNSELLADNCLQAIKEEKNSIKIDTIYPHKLNIGPCLSCFACYEDGKCIIDDDMQTLYKKFDDSRIIIVSTPIFFNGPPSSLKAMIDRCQAIWSGKYMANSSPITRDKKRYGFLLATGGAPAYDEQFTATQLIISMLFRVINADFSDHLFIPNVDEKPVKTENNIQKAAYKLGKKIAYSFLP